MENKSNLSAAPAASSPLLPFSLTGKAAELEKQLSEQRFALGSIALTGQATVLYAPPNTGKTLITLWLLREAITAGHLDSEKVYYLNLDDSGHGLVEKLKIAQDLGIHMLCDGYATFSANHFAEHLASFDNADGYVVIVDTLKKVSDLMSKKESSTFNKVVRRFTSRGGTFIGMSHTNKKRSSDGQLVHAGTTDVLEDFDCAYMLSLMKATDNAAGQPVVKLLNIKKRGGVCEAAAYTFDSTQADYLSLLNSVRELDPEHLSALDAREALIDQAHLIRAVEEVIAEADTQKMRLIQEVVRRTAAGRNQIERLLQEYEGDQATKRWNYKVGARGMKVYHLNDGRCPLPEPQVPSVLAPQRSTAPASGKPVVRRIEQPMTDAEVARLPDGNYEIAGRFLTVLGGEVF